MKGKTQKILYAMLSMAIVFGLFTAIPPVAGALDENDGGTCEIYNFNDIYIGGPYSLAEAMEKVENIQVIRLLVDIATVDTLLITRGYHYYLDLNGFSFTVSGDLIFDGNAITFVNRNKDKNSHLYISGDITSIGNLPASLYVYYDIDAFVAGSVYSDYKGVVAQSGADVQIAGNVEVEVEVDYIGVHDIYGVLAEGLGAAVAVGGDITVRLTGGENSIAYGIVCNLDAKASVGGNVYVYSNREAYGAFCVLNRYYDAPAANRSWILSELTINGNVYVESSDCATGVFCEDEATMTINGNVNVTAENRVSGVRSDCNHFEIGTIAEVFIGGNVTVAGGYGYGASAENNGRITIDGIIVTGDNDEIHTIMINGDPKIIEADNDNPSKKPGYDQYSWFDEKQGYDKSIDIKKMTAIWIYNPKPPEISGPAEIGLTEGYSATSIPYTITGAPDPTVTLSGNTGDGKIVWDSFTSKLYIARGLEGSSDGIEYMVTLTASNGIEPDAGVTIKLRVIKDDSNNPSPNLNPNPSPNPNPNPNPNLNPSPNPSPGPSTGGGSVTITIPAVIMVSYDANGGIGSMAGSAVSPAGSSYMIKENVFTRESFRFNGWNIKADGSGTAYADKATIEDVTESIILFAQWTRIPILESDEHVCYIYGYPDGSVGPENPVTRAEAAIIFYRLIVADDKEAPLTSSFTDVKVDAWYTLAIAYLEKYDIIVDSASGRFRPNEAITRAEYAALACGFDQIETGEPNAFPDVPEGHWALGYINNAAAKGWVEGFPDGTFRPEDTITRAQLVTIINRMLDRRIELENIPGDAPVFSDLEESHWAYCDFIEASSEHEYTRLASGFEIWR